MPTLYIAHDIPQDIIDLNCARQHEAHTAADLEQHAGWLVYPDAAARDAACQRVHVTPHQPAVTVPGPMLYPLTPNQALRRVLLYGHEHRSENAAALARIPTPAELSAFYSGGNWNGVGSAADGYRRQITGAVAGLTTDEVLQWGAHRHGIDENIVRAMAWQESQWKQSATGDWKTDTSIVPPDAAQSFYNPITKHRITGVTSVDSVPDGYRREYAESYGILQMKHRYHATAVWPLSRDSLAFNVDYVLQHVRAVMDGRITWLKDRTPSPGYPPYNTSGGNDVWLSVGQWFSGGWADAGALDYISKVQQRLADRPWEAL